MTFQFFENKITYNENGKDLAQLKFREENNVFSLDSMFVDPSLRGKGIAAKLMEEMIGLLREKQATCIPICSYVIAWFEKHPEYNEFLK